jgi:hypothetical protein
MAKAGFINKSKFTSEEDDGSHDYEIPQSSDLVSIPTNMIPGLSGVSGGRVLLGDKAVLQSISLKHREAPLVRPTDNHNKKSFSARLGDEMVAVRSQHNGVVTKVTPDAIHVGDEIHELYNYHQLGRKTALHHTPTVKEGDKVKKGDLLATSNFSDAKGNLSLGTNLRTAVMPYRGANFEDAFVVTETGAKKLVAEQVLRYRIDTRFGTETDKKKYYSVFPNKYTNAQLDKLDADGVIKEGMELHHGDPMVLAYTPRTLKTQDIDLGRISKSLKNAYSDSTHVWDHEHPGKVVRVNKTRDVVTLQIFTERPLQESDKLCLSPDHDVLTRDGWKPVAQVTLLDEVYTLNPENDNIELQTPIGTPVYDYTGPMYECVSTQVSMCVTPNHKLYCASLTKRNKQSPRYSLCPASEKYGRPYMLKNNGLWQGVTPETYTIPGFKSLQGRDLPDVVFPTRIFLCLLGIFLADGNTFWHEPSGSYGIDIAQKKEPETTILAEFFAANGIAYTREGAVFRIYSKVLAKYFKQFGRAYDKHIPKDVFLFAKQDLEYLYHFLMMGDGSEKGTGHGLVTISPQLADDFQQLCLLIGKASKKKFRPGGQLVYFPGRDKPSIASDSYWCSVFRKKNQPSINARKNKAKCYKEEYVQYTGKVHCLTFEKNHIFYIRRAGKCHWTGNSNFFGAKGVVRIVKDSEAPMDKDGKPVDAILNSMSITSRVAPALLNVLAMGKVAQKLGKPLKITPFVKGSSVDKTIELLKKHNVSEQEELYDPVSGNHLTASVGPLFINRLVHISEDKVGDRGHGRAYSLDMQPAKVEHDAAKRVGNLMTTALLSHGATSFLRDIALVKATKNDEYWRAVKMGLPPPTPQAPFIYDKFLATLKGAGVNIKKNGDVSTILPQTDKDVAALSKGAIHEPTTFKVKDNELIPEENGLFDVSKVGVSGNHFNHVELPNAIPNPISEDYLRKLLGITQKQYDEGIISGETVKKIEALNIDTEIQKQKDYLKTGKVTNRDNAYKLLRFLTNLKQHDVSLKDLLLTKIPIIPAKFRPIAQMGDMTFSADVNHLYKELLLNNKALKKSQTLPQEKIDALKTAQYEAVKAIYGLEAPTNTKLVEKNVSGLLSSMLGIQGHRGKHSTFQAKVVNKPVDLVGRAVLVPDATLGLDQASVPASILWKTYAPFTIRNLVKRGVAATKAQEYVTNRHPLAAQAMHEELAHRPAVITRDPQLHKYSAQAFYLKANSEKGDHSLKMNPLVYKGLGADNDGDQLNINIPASEDARKEVIEKMLPSKNLLGPASFAPMYVPSNEASLGLFQLSTEDKKNTPKHYKTEAEVLKAFEKGELMPGDNVKIG